jgi:hypothetical protein
LSPVTIFLKSRLSFFCSLDPCLPTREKYFTFSTSWLAIRVMVQLVETTASFTDLSRQIIKKDLNTCHHLDTKMLHSSVLTDIRITAFTKYSNALFDIPTAHTVG